MQLLDPIANRVLLGPPAEESEPDHIRKWLWRPFVPPDCSLRHWDLLNLLRLAALLAEGPETWDDPPGSAEVAELCRRWGEEFLRDQDSLREGEDLRDVLEETLALLPQIETWPETVPEPARPRPLTILRQLLEGRLGSRMLTKVSEHRLTEEACAFGLNNEEVEGCLDYLLARRGALRERELEDLIGEYVESGMYPGMKLKVVGRNTWDNALRLLEIHGFDSAEARRRLEGMLEDRGILHESQAASEWRDEISSHFASRIRKRSYRRQDVEEIQASLQSKGLHERLARRWVQKYITDEGLEER